MVFSVLFGLVVWVSMLFSQIINPLILAFLIVINGVFMVIGVGMVLPLYWFSYVILLTFLGGLLVVFVYVSSLCPNEPTLSFGGFLWMALILSLLVSVEWMSSVDFGYFGLFTEVSGLAKMYFFGMEVVVSLLVVYLLLVLLVVVDLSLVFEGSLRVGYDKKG